MYLVYIQNLLIVLFFLYCFFFYFLLFFFFFFFVLFFCIFFFFFFSSRRRHTRWNCDWSSDVCSSDLVRPTAKSRPPFSSIQSIWSASSSSVPTAGVL